MDNVALIVHGGAWDIAPSLVEACRAGVGRALDRGWQVLQSGGSAIDACEQAIIELEDEPAFDAGVGSHLNRDGKVQLDAILMNGETLKAGAIAAVERLRNPIRLARLVLEKSPHMMLASQGAEQFAIENGMALCDPRELVIERELTAWKLRSNAVTSLGTVGAVALDASGNVAAGTSTGGTFFKYPGRVGDSPLIGCGCYADNWAGGVSTTGHGESMMKVVLAKTANDLMLSGRSPQEAADAAISILSQRTQGQGGLIVLDRTGRAGAAFSTPHMTYAYRTATDYCVWRIR